MTPKELPSIEVIAATVEDAVSQGLEELNLTEDAVFVEVLDGGARGLFGLGGRQVRVRLTVKPSVLEPKPAQQPLPKPPKPTSLASQLGTPTAARKKAPAVRRETKTAVKPAAKPKPLPQPKPVAVEVEQDDVLAAARSTVAELLEKMNVTASLDVSDDKADEDGNRPVRVDIHGDDLGILIGRRADILNALQYIVSLMVGKKVGHWMQVIVDVEGYRQRREKQLRAMAVRMADQAIKTGRRQVLEPMSAAERRIIHIELREHPDVTTMSVGEEPSRKVTIVPKQ